MDLNVRLDGKIAIVTGAASGLGRGMAEGLASVGAHIVAADINYEGAQETAKEIARQSGSAEAYKLDTTDSSQFNALVDYLVKKYGRIDILINNAGINRRNLIQNMPEEDFKKVIDVNLIGVWIGCKAVAPVMMAQKSGKIVSTCSMMGIGASLKEMSAYCSSKGGVASLTRNLAVELVDYNINVNAVAPGYVLTDLTAKLKANEEMYSDLLRRTPMKRFGTIEEVAGPVVFLCSEMSSYMTGQTVAIDGGWLAW